jgi:hypothetical protein
MRPLDTPQDWLEAAFLARVLAVQIEDPEAKTAMERVADDCALIALELGELLGDVGTVH